MNSGTAAGLLTLWIICGKGENVEGTQIAEILDKITPVKDIDVKGKTVILRVDLNSSVKGGKLLKGPKIAEHFKTIKGLLDREAKLVILSHQGRKGRDDFINLKQHRDCLQDMLGEGIAFYTWDKNFVKGMRKLKEGQAMMLDNTRFLDFEAKDAKPEEHAKQEVIRKLASAADLYVLDALSVAHRSHATVVGFIPLLKSFAGPVLYSELRALNKVSAIKDNTTLVLGGMKPDDSLPVMEKMLEDGKAKKVLLGGALGELAIMAKGSKLGIKERFLQEKGLIEFVPKIKALIEKFHENIMFPVDLAVKQNALREEISLAELPIDNMIFDIGEVTANTYASEIKKADLVIMNGPVGRFESYQFAFGTRKILEALTEANGFTLVGGGDTVTALTRLGFKNKEFSHVSLAGKALLKLLAGGRLAGLEALAKMGK